MAWRHGAWKQYEQVLRLLWTLADRRQTTNDHSKEQAVIGFGEGEVFLLFAAPRDRLNPLEPLYLLLRKGPRVSQSVMSQPRHTLCICRPREGEETRFVQLCSVHVP